MIFNVSDYEGLAMLDIFDKTIRVRILVSNMIHETIEATFEVMVLSRGKGMQVMRKYEGEWRDEPIIYFYNCGEPALRISIDELFEGTKDVPLQMIDLNEGELNGLFEASKPSILPLVDGEVVQKNCQIKTVVENSPNQKVPKILFCIKFGGDEITLVDLNSP